MIAMSNTSSESFEPFVFEGGTQVCLLVHGFTGSPHETYELGRYLFERGYSVYGLRLAGHGGTSEDLALTPWVDWLASVDTALNLLETRYAAVNLIGFSLGGALSILEARRHKLRRMALLATPLRIQGDWRVNLIGFARHTTAWYYPLEYADLSDPEVRATILAHAPDIDLDDPQVQTYVRQNVRISVAAADELRRALRVAQAGLPLVQTPVLVMHGRDDQIAPCDSAELIVSRIGSRYCRMVWWPETGHQLLLYGPHRGRIFDCVYRFLAD
jgi:carboxylesterase